MAVVTRRTQTNRMAAPTTYPHPTPTTARIATTAAVSQSPGAILSASLQASLVGGVGILALLLLGLIDSVALAIIVMPGFIVVWLCTGMLAGAFAGDAVRNTVEGGKVGWLAGFWSGVYGGIAAMIMAAFGLYFTWFGDNLVVQLTAEQVATFSSYGFTPAMIAMASRVIFALIASGIIGSLVSALFSSIGGMVYAKISA